jgi:hypothetical protein
MRRLRHSRGERQDKEDIMHLDISTPTDNSIVTGTLDSNGPYAAVKIFHINIDLGRKMIQVHYEYGNMSGTTWTRGMVPRGKSSGATLRGDDFDGIMAATHATAASSDVIENALYLWLQANADVPAGTVTPALA